jgi:hypothetical protein
MPSISAGPRQDRNRERNGGRDCGQRRHAEIKPVTGLHSACRTAVTAAAIIHTVMTMANGAAQHFAEGA